MAKAWIALEHSSPARTVYEHSLAKQLVEIGCTADGAPYVILGLLATLRGLDGPHSATLAGNFFDEAQCAGAKGLPDDAKAKVKTIREAGVQGSATGIPASNR